MSWKRQGQPDGKYIPNVKANDAYHKSYVAMLKDDEEGYNSQCDTFNALINHVDIAEALTVELDENCHSPSTIDTDTPIGWSAIPINIIELENGTEHPTEDIYEPAPAWERPPGHAVQGIDAFKIMCHVNSLTEPATIAIGDSGAAPTLISQSFLNLLAMSKPRPRSRRKLKLLQLMGSAGCSKYVRLNLYFRSQLGPVCLKGVEAYVVKDMQANLIIGEDTQCAWQLHTI
jgi:hypothetical protein